MTDQERALTIPPPDSEMLANIREFARRAGSLVVSDLASREGAATQLREVATFAKFIDDDRKKRTRPLDAEKKAIMDEYRPAEADLANARSMLTAGILKFDTEERRKAEEAQRAADAAAEKERARLAKLAEKAEARGDAHKAQEFERRSEFVATQAPVAVPPPKLDGVSTRKVWRYEIVDAKHIPSRYLIVDTKALDAAVRSLGADAANMIPGIRVWAEETAVVRGI